MVAARGSLQKFLVDDAWSIRAWTRDVECATILDAADFDIKDKVAVAMDAMGLLPQRRRACHACGIVPQLGSARYSRRSRHPLGLEWKCECGSAPNILASTVWHNRSFERLVPATFLYAVGRRVSDIIFEFELHQQHFQEWLHLVQELMADAVLRDALPVPAKVGGLGIKVKVDETYLNRPKRCAAPFRRLPAADARWLWGAVSDDGLLAGEVLFVLLPDTANARGAEALRNALLNCVAPGSIIIHDDWGAYRALDWDALPFEHDARSVVNHSKELINVFGEDTNIIENVWSVLKRWLREKH